MAWLLMIGMDDGWMTGGDGNKYRGLVLPPEIKKLINAEKSTPPGR
jgi:hypothetical protein